MNRFFRPSIFNFIFWLYQVVGFILAVMALYGYAQTHSLLYTVTFGVLYSILIYFLWPFYLLFGGSTMVR